MENLCETGCGVIKSDTKPEKTYIPDLPNLIVQVLWSLFLIGSKFESLNNSIKK